MDGTTLTAKKLYSVNFIESNKKLCLSLHYNGANSYLFVNGTKTHKYEAKDSETVASPLCLGKVLIGFSIHDMIKTGLNEYFYDLSVD